jgi:hypothetical protein
MSENAQSMVKTISVIVTCVFTVVTVIWSAAKVVGVVEATSRHVVDHESRIRALEQIPGDIKAIRVMLEQGNRR